MKSTTLRGIAVSPGLAIGPARVLEFEAEAALQTPAGPIVIEEELARFRESLGEAEKLLQKIQQSVRQKAGEQDAMIFQAQLAILRDGSAQEEVVRRIREERVSAEVSVLRLMKGFDERFRSLAGPSRDWAAEVKDPWAVVLQALQKHKEQRLLAGREEVVLVTEELAPSLAMYLEKGKVVAVVSERGGRYSHGAILARSFGVPAIVGVEKATSRIAPGMKVVVNGDEGEVLLQPGEAELSEHRRRKRERGEREQALQARAAEPARTRDGRHVSVQANIESFRDFDTFDLSIVDGVGLLRTEFLFHERGELPSEEEQVGIYREALCRLKGRPVTFRTLDVGGDKPLPMLQTPRENNPVLGWRGLRITLAWRDLLIVQLRALLRASAYGPARILLPMVTSLEEVRTVRKLLDELRRDLERSGEKTGGKVPLGIMVEVPASAFVLRHILGELEFVSVGTNDLAQYLLAVDRDNPWVAALYEPFHPAVLQVVAEAARAARELGKPISVCGEMAGDPEAALLFLAMGIEELSMSPHFVPAVKALLREADAGELRLLVEEVLRLGSSAQVRELLRSRAEKLWKSFAEGNNVGGAPLPEGRSGKKKMRT